MEQSQKRQHSKFNPPLKKTVDTSLSESISQASCGSATSWNLPPTQTHTVLSYCELQSQEKCSTTDAGGQTDRNFSLVKNSRKYDYGIKRARKPVHSRPKSHAGTDANVYDYCLTPSEQVRHKRTRTKEQIEIDRTVLHHIATIRAEIQTIRNQYSKKHQYSTSKNTEDTNNYLAEE